MLPRKTTGISVAGSLLVDSDYLKSNIEFNDKYIEVEIKEFEIRSIRGFSEIPVSFASIKKFGSILAKLGLTILIKKESKVMARIGFDIEPGTIARLVTGPHLQINNIEVFKSVLKGK